MRQRARLEGRRFPKRLLRIHLQQFFGYSDPAMEAALGDIPLYQEFAHLDAGITRLPDENTILRFRHMLEEQQRGHQKMGTVNATHSANGLLLKQGTAIDATLVAAPSSTKNSTGTRDPEMHQTKKRNRWHFGMKAHIGVDSDSGLVHTVSTTAANAHDIVQAAALLHGQGSDVFSNSGYRGLAKNTANLISLFALSNLWMVRKRLLNMGAQG